METNRNALKVAQQVIVALSHDEGMNDFIDSSDASPQGTESSATFTMSQTQDRIVPGRRGPGSRIPVGTVTYTVTITAAYEPFEE